MATSLVGHVQQSVKADVSIQNVQRSEASPARRACRRPARLGVSTILARSFARCRVLTCLAQSDATSYFPVGIDVPHCVQSSALTRLTVKLVATSRRGPWSLTTFSVKHTKR